MNKAWDVVPPKKDPGDSQVFEWMSQAFQLAADFYYPDGRPQKQWYQDQADMFAGLAFEQKDRTSNEAIVKKMFEGEE